MTKERNDSSWAHLIGGGYAYVQHGMDKVIEWGFAKMNKASREQKGAAKNSEPSNQYVANAKKFGKQAMRFASSTVQAYYATYRELKKKDTVI